MRADDSRRIGVIGTFVWDVIYGRDPRSTPVEEWGGITYALSGLDAALPDDWEIVPLIKVGDDLADRGHAISLARCGASPPTRGRSRCRTPTIASSCATTTDERRSEMLTRRRARLELARTQAGARHRAARRALHQLAQRLGARSRDGEAHPAALSRSDLLRPAHARVGRAAERAAHAASAAERRASGARASTSCR